MKKKPAALQGILMEVECVPTLVYIMCVYVHYRSKAQRPQIYGQDM